MMHARRIATSFVISMFAASAVPLAAFAQVNADQVRNLVSKGNNLMHAHQFQQAIDQYQEALKLDPNCAIARGNIVESHNNWGISYFQQHKYREALGEWQKCLELSPNHPNAKRNIGILNQVAAQQGLDLTSDMGVGGGSPTGGYDPLTGAGSLPVKKGSGKAANGAGGSAAGANTPIGKVEVPKVQPPSAGAVILTPGVHVDSPDANGGGSAVAPGGDSFSAAPGSAVAPVQATSTSTPPVNSYGSYGTQAPSAPPSGQAQTAQPPLAHSQAPTAQAPVQPAGNVSRTTSVSSAMGSIDDQLSAIETKVYGQRESNMTVMQRLDRIEREVAGQPRPGTIMERVEYLKQSFGLH